PNAQAGDFLSDSCPLVPGSLPVLLIVDIPHALDVRLIGLEAALLEDLDDAARLRIDPGAGVAVLRRHADHLRITAQIDVRSRRVERLAQALLQLAAGNQ